MSQSWGKHVCTGSWDGKAHILTNIFLQKLRNETWWQITNFPLWRSHWIHMISYSLLNSKSFFSIFFPIKWEVTFRWCYTVNWITVAGKVVLVLICYNLWNLEWVSWEKSFLGTFLLQETRYFNSKTILSANTYIHINLYMPVHRHTHLHTCMYMHLKNCTYSLLFLEKKKILYKGKFIRSIDWSLFSLQLNCKRHMIQHPTASTSDMLILNTSSVKLKGFLVCFNLKVI